MLRIFYNLRAGADVSANLFIVLPISRLGGSKYPDTIAS